MKLSKLEEAERVDMTQALAYAIAYAVYGSDAYVLVDGEPGEYSVAVLRLDGTIKIPAVSSEFRYVTSDDGFCHPTGRILISVGIDLEKEML